MITVYTIAYNEEILIEFFIQHYRKYFPNCHIVIYDNESTDNTVSIAKKYGCEIITYQTNNTISDSKYLEIKNNCWKESKTNWNIICDCDELIEINEDQLKLEENLGKNIISFTAYTLVNNSNTIDLHNMCYGYRDNDYDKQHLFNKQQICEINYLPGCHLSRPQTFTNYKINYSDNQYRTLHYKFLSPQYTINRYRLFEKRLSDENKKHRWGFQYAFSDEKIINDYNNASNGAIKLL